MRVTLNGRAMGYFVDVIRGTIALLEEYSCQIARGEGGRVRGKEYSCHIANCCNNRMDVISSMKPRAVWC